MTIIPPPNQAELLRATATRTVSKSYFVLNLSQPALNRAERRVRAMLARRACKEKAR